MAGDPGEHVRSLWSGAVLIDEDASAARYREAAIRWADLAERHPGTAALWRALADRAVATARRLATDLSLS